MKNSRIILSLVAVLLSTAAWAVTLSPTLDVLYRSKDDKSHFEKVSSKDTPLKSDNMEVFECKWSSNLFAIQRYEIANFATAKTLTLTLSLGTTGANNHAAVWNFPYEMPESVSYDATKRSQFFTNVETVTGVTIHTTEGSFTHQLAVSSCSENTLGTGKWTFTIDAGGLKPAGYTEDGKAIIQLLITSNAPNASGQVKYYTNNSSNDASYRPKLDVTYGTGNLQNPITEINYRFNTSSQWNDANFPKLGESTESVECNYAGRLFVVEQFAIENYSPEKIYTLTLTKNGANNSISIWDFPYASPIQKDNAVCPSVVTDIQNVTGATITADPVVAPSTTPIQTKSMNGSNQWVFTIGGYQLTPISWSGTTARVSILLTGPSNSKYYSIQGENKPTLIESGSYPVHIEGGAYYSTLAEAVSAASANDIITLLDDVTISGSRLDIQKALTIQGATGAEKIICGVATNSIMILANGSTNKTVTFKNLIVDGNNATRSIQTFENGTDQTKLEFENVSVINTTYSEICGDVKNNGSEIILKGNNSFPTGVFLNRNKRIDGQYATHTAPMRITLASDYEENYAIVLCCSDPRPYQAIDEAGATGWELYDGESGSCGHELKGRKIPLITLNDNVDNSTAISTTYVGQKVDATIARSMPNDGTTNATFCVPFDVDAATVARQLGNANLVEYKDATVIGEEATFHFVDAEDGIKAGVPYLICPEAGATLDLTFRGVTIKNETHPSEDTHYRFIPLFSQTNVGTGSENKSIVYLGAGNQLFWAGASCTINGFRAYLQAKSPAASAVKRFSIGRYNTPTGMDNVQGEKAQCTKVLRNGQVLIIRDGIEYNLMGQMVK